MSPGGFYAANQTAYTVSQVNEYIKAKMDQDRVLSSILVRGEISNYKRYPSGHHYFSLKDAEGSLKCVMFAGSARTLRFQPANGMQVLALGRISVFPRDGAYQLYVNQLMEDGRGKLDEEFERLRRRLEAEGLFDAARKRPLPIFPNKVAVVTSPVGAAIRDIIQNIGARWPMTEVLVVPVRVQGVEAPGEIANALQRVNQRKDIDLIITGRGGGSREELWAFNEEIVARAIAASRIPVISAVGHAPDVSISDYVADATATTPTKAGQMAVPSQDEWRHRLEVLQQRMVRAEQGRLADARKQLQRLQSSRVMQSAAAPIQERRMLLDSRRQRMISAFTLQLKDERHALEGLEQRLAGALPAQIKDSRRLLDSRVQRMETGMERSLKQQRMRLARIAGSLDAMSPLKVLARGYAVARKDGNLVSSTEQAGLGEKLDVILTDGVLNCTVDGKEKLPWQK